MDLLQELNTYKYLFLEDIGEPEDLTLRLFISVGIVSDTEEDITISGKIIKGVRSVKPSNVHYQITFTNYIAYFVLNESYDKANSELKEENWKGNVLKTSNHTSFIEYLEDITEISKEFEGEYTHYRIFCQDHVINVVSTGKPTIQKLIKSQFVIDPESDVM